VFINPGINIGENTALGANSVVTHNLPPHAVCAGAPARVVRFKSYLSEEHRIELAKQYANVCTKPCE
jgi:maltose O-acetyltransferase